MPWAQERQALYAIGVLVALVLLGAVFAFFFLYEKPSCTDGKQNQGETGVDCGGVCSRLCEAPQVASLWVRPVKVADGVYHAVAMIQNPVTDAGANRLPYKFSLYDADNILIAERSGTTTLEPGEIMPLFEANIVTGERTPARAFIAFGMGEWHFADRMDNPLVVGSSVFNEETLTLNAEVHNPSLTSIARATFTALLYGEGDTVIGASQTILSDIPARGSKQAVFTWQELPAPVVRSVITTRLK